MFEGLYFEYPKAVSFIFVYIACEAYCKLRSSAIYFPRAAGLTQETAEVSVLMWILRWLGILMLTLSFMSPVRDALFELSPAEGYDIALVLDASQSMKGAGFDALEPEKSRFDAVKEIVEEFIASRRDDNLGLVLFGDFAYVASPLTFDRDLLGEVVEHLQPGMAGKSTAIYEAIGESVRLLSGSKAKSRVSILLSDGYNTSAGRIPLQAAMALAKKEGVRFYTIGIGGENAYDGALLEYIATESGGRYFSAENAQTLQKVYAAIDSLEKSDIERYEYTFKEYLYVYPLFLAFFVLLWYVYLRNRRGWL